MEYKTLFSPIDIGGVTIKNRIVMSPMLMGFGKFDGEPTPKLMDYYEERAKGGTGLIITEITRINDVTGASAFGQLAVSKDYQIEKLKEFAERIHRHGAKLFVQLHHPGRQNIGLMIGTVPMSIAFDKMTKLYSKFLFKIVPAGRVLMKKKLVPAAVCPSKVESSYFSGGRVRALRKGEIKKLINQFIEGAVRCQKAGVDGVELHGTHGYLIQQFLSPHTNRRKDEYGGSFENRMRFITEIIEGIRQRCGSYPIIVRISVDENYDKIGRKDTGYGLNEGLKICKRLEELGVDALDVSNASYDAFNYWLEPTSFRLGWRKSYAKAVKDVVKIPVLAANLIRTPQQAEEQLNEGVQDMISLGRPQIADPYFANKAMENRSDEIKRCICCLYCFESMQENAYRGTHGCCSVNPFVGKEGSSLAVNGNRRKVVIVGGGVAGLMCAELLLRRNFDVTVLEKERELGGQLQLANKPPFKEKMSWCIEDLAVNVKKLGGDIILNVNADYKFINEYKPYAVILATGGLAVKPRSIKGVENKNVFTTTDILSKNVFLNNQNIAVIGSGMTGLETAEFLLENDNKVTVIEMAKEIAPNTWFQHLDDLIPKLKEKGTQFMVNTKLISINDKGIEVENIKNKRSENLDFDAVVLSLGVRPNNALYNELNGKFDKLYVIGDAQKTGRIFNATQSAYKLAEELN